MRGCSPMVSKSMRLSVRLSFSPGFPHEQEAVSAIHRSGLFSVASPEEEYYRAVCDGILAGTDFASHILENEPLLDGSDPFVVAVSDQMTDTPDIPLIYSTDQTEAEVTAALTKASETMKLRHSEILREFSGLGFYRRFTNRPAAKTRSLAVAQFYFGDYKAALPLFEEIQEEWPLYAARMVGWCRLMLNQGGLIPCFDILLLHSRYDLLYRSLGILPRRPRTAVEYLLVDKPGTRGAALLLEYACAISAAGRSEVPLASRLLKRLETRIADISRAAGEEGRVFWRGLLEQIHERVSGM